MDLDTSSYQDDAPEEKKRTSFLNETIRSSETDDTDDNNSGNLNRPPNPYANANLLSKLLFAWPKKLTDTESSVITESDLPDVLQAESSEENLRNFSKMWNDEKARAAKVMKEYNTQKDQSDSNGAPKSATPSLAYAIRQDFLSSSLVVQVTHFVIAIGKLAQALALGKLLQSFEVQDDKGYLWALLLVLSGLICLIGPHHILWFTTLKGMQYRTGAVAMIYDKSLRLKSSSVAGRAINLATNDVERFLLASMFCSYLFWAPFLSVGVLGVGWIMIGWSFVVGFMIFVAVIVPIQLYVGRRFAYLRSRIATLTDARVTLVSQAIAGVKVAKMNSYEEKFEREISAIRKQEVMMMQQVNRFRAMNEAIFYAASVTTSVIIFLFRVTSGGLLTPMNVFTTFILINTAQVEITKFLAVAVMVSRVIGNYIIRW